MAIDSHQKRASAVSLLVPSMVPALVPDGSVERQSSIWAYSGIAAGDPSPVPVCVFFTTETFTVPSLTTETFTAPAFSTETFTYPELDTETWDE